MKNILYSKQAKNKKKEESVKVPSTTNALINSFTPLRTTPKDSLYEADIKSNPYNKYVKNALLSENSKTKKAATIKPESVKPTQAAQPTNALTDYWKQPVIGKLSLDQFANLAGTAAYALDPEGFGGRLGKDVAAMGANAYSKRMQKEYEAPNKLLQRKLLTAQIGKIKAEQPGKWEAVLAYGRANGMDLPEILDLYSKNVGTKAKPNVKYVVDNKGNVSTFVDGTLKSGTGKGADVTGKVSKVVTDDDGNVTLINARGDVVGTMPKIGKTKSTPGKSKKVPTIKTLMDSEELLMRNPTDPNFGPQADLINQYGNKDYTYSWQNVNVPEVNRFGRETGELIVQEQWVKNPRAMELEENGSIALGEISPPGTEDPGRTKAEKALRARLVEAKKTDPTIDIERAMNSYKEQGYY